jgi:hypothetical protein
VIKDRGVSPFGDIPVAVFNANPCLTDANVTDGPVLIDLANENIKHYNLTSDHEKILHKCTPILTTVNLRDSEANLGGVAGLDVRLDCDEGGGASYTEAPGTSLSERREWIALLEKHLHEMGASLFTEGSQKNGMTATEVRERGGSQQSRISQIADAWHDCLENVLIWFARWKGEEPKGAIIPGVKASDLVVTPADLPALSQMVERGQHSRKNLWAIEKKLGILPDDFDDDQEYQNLEEEQRRLGGAAGAQLDRLLNGGGIE